MTGNKGMGAATGLSFGDAVAAVLQGARERRPRSEVVPIEQAFGRALSHDVFSRIALPPWDNAGMDGYAVQKADVLGAAVDVPRVLPVVGTSVAGADPTALPWVQQGTAVRIMTGAPMPPGADAVVRIEDTDGGETAVQIRHDRDVLGRGNVRPRGEDIAANSVLFTAGTSLRASHLGALASIGMRDVPVFAAPRVTIISSGDELVLLDRFDEVESGHRIVSSSSYALPALFRGTGAEVTMAPLVHDSLEALTRAIGDALDAGCDLLVTTGGVSVGAHDYTRDALAALGGSQSFWRARIRPGGPVGTGTVRSVPWVGLPGNPVSTMVTGALFAWPLLRALGGHTAVHHARIPVRMMDAAETPAPLTYFLRIALRVGPDGMLEGRLAGAQGSNLLRTMALADALLEVPEHVAQVEAGSVLSALLLPDAPMLFAATEGVS